MNMISCKALGKALMKLVQATRRHNLAAPFPDQVHVSVAAQATRAARVTRAASATGATRSIRAADRVKILKK